VLAVPLAPKETVASVVVPSRNVTLPVGVPRPLVTVTRAVNVTDSPSLDGFMLELTAVAVVARFTLYETLELWSGRKVRCAGRKDGLEISSPDAVA
jgi:hypothetical protein